MPTVLCCPDKLRGALDAPGAAEALGVGARRAGWSARLLPLADGGEGTRSIVAHSSPGATTRLIACVDAHGRRIEAPLTLLDGHTALIESAECIGLSLIDRAERDPLRASSRGLAALVAAALADGARSIQIALGGSATIDGGLGLLVGLGARAYDASGAGLAGGGADLIRLAGIDLAPARALLTGVTITGLVDVDAPLGGPNGAARRFGPQKGAGEHDVELLDAALGRLGRLFGAAADVPGAGAAGGLGAALRALGADLRPGVDAVMQAVGFEQALAACDLVLTAEGRIDPSTLQGKVPARVLAAAGSVPTVIVGGVVDAEAVLALFQRGARDVVSLEIPGRPRPTALAAAAADLADAAERACRSLSPAR